MSRDSHPRPNVDQAITQFEPESVLAGRVPRPGVDPERAIDQGWISISQSDKSV
jgi:hypothetical protein